MYLVTTKNRNKKKLLHSPTVVHFKIVLVILWHFCVYMLNINDLAECQCTVIKLLKYLNDVVKKLQIVNQSNWHRFVICVRGACKLRALSRLNIIVLCDFIGVLLSILV